MFAAGLLVARRGLFGHHDPTVVAGAAAGALAASLPALLAIVMSLVELQRVRRAQSAAARDADLPLGAGLAWRRFAWSC